MYCVFWFIVLIFNYFHRLQPIISDVFVLIIVIITVLYSPGYFSFESKFITKIFPVRDYLLSKFSDGAAKYQFPKDFFQDDFYFKNYFLHRKNNAEAIMYVYNVSTFSEKISHVFSNNKIVNIREIYILLDQYPILKNLKFGQIISLIILKNGRLQSLLWKVSSTESRIYNRIACSDNFVENIIIKFNEFDQWNYIMIIGRLYDNFINSVRFLGLDNSNIQKIVNALEWQVNFQKLHKGDLFSILTMCSESCDKSTFEITNKLVVVAVRLHTIGKDYYAFRADNGKFYNRDAISMEGGFIRFPTLKPFRVSSNFSLKRLNPITGRVSPHLGVDFAVPIGTPVLSIGDGEVVVSKHGHISGNYVVIRHSDCCITRYMHLSRLLVKVGQIVKKGENIAFSGNTGRSTGPHLHFEIWINHKPVNPLTVNFLHGEKLIGYDRINYMKKVATIMPYLHFN